MSAIRTTNPERCCPQNKAALNSILKRNTLKPTKRLLILVPVVLLSLASFSQKKKTQKSSTNENWLRVAGDQIVNQRGDTVLLRGFGLGGMLHMENFIDGYPANEETMREGLQNVLGEKKYNLYFDNFYKSYFTEPDAAYIQSLGLNLVRIPINYHLFEDDMNPGVIKEGAFAYLDSVIARCARHQIYT